jgi:hypothetical protein
MSQNGSQPNSGSDPRSSGTHIRATTPVISQHDNAKTQGDMSSLRSAAWEVCDETSDVGMFGSSGTGIARTLAAPHLTV